MTHDPGKIGGLGGDRRGLLAQDSDGATHLFFAVFGGQEEAQARRPFGEGGVGFLAAI